MFKSRRKILKKILAISGFGLTSPTSLITPLSANTLRENNKFRPDSYNKIFSELFEQKPFIDTYKIEFSRLPDIAENGAVVPITVTSILKNVEKIFILVEKNPHPLIAEFQLSPALEPHVSARFKMAKTSDVIVIVKANGKYYRKAKHVKVAIGGCG